jgi:putative drug exporter of the RND superfamily
MFLRLADLTIRRRRLLLLVAVIAFAVSGTFGGNVASELSSGGFDDPRSESYRADEVLAGTFGTATPNVVLLVTSASGDLDDEATAAAGRAVTDRLARLEGVEEIVGYWSLPPGNPLRSDAGDRALVLGRIAGDDNLVSERIGEISPAMRQQDGAVTVDVGGFAEVFHEVGETIESDLVRAELIALPITLLLLLLVFRSAVAAVLPLVVGALSVVTTFAALRVINGFTEVSIFSLNLTTAMGLGLAIDYSLFVISRYREELARGREPHEAVVRTVRTAGRTVLFSALTVAVSLSALLVFPIAFLRSFAYAGIAVATLAGIWSVVVLPAALAVIGTRIDALALRRRPAVASGAAEENGTWHRIATLVMRRPLPIATVAIVVLVALGTPFLRLELGLPDDRVLPPSSPARAVTDVVREEFRAGEAGALSVVAADTGDPAGRRAEIDRYATELSTLPGVARVDAYTGVYADGGQLVPETSFTVERFGRATATYLSAVPSVEPMSPAGERLAKDVRAADAPFEVAVTGTSATLVDAKAALVERLPLAALIVGVVTFVLLFLMFGSVVIPAKAIVLNILSLSATFGAMVWVFQDGNLAGFLDFTATGSIAATMPILMFCIAFGLSMDYEVFLLSRIKEEHDRTGDNVRSVALGLERTGRIVTAAAVLISVVFLAFATSGVSFIKMFGIGLALAVLMDAFVIRSTLVPAFMRLAGEVNWWAPAPLRRLHDRIGLSEHADLDDGPPGQEPAVAEPVDLDPASVVVPAGAPR